ncbi:FAD-dependent monooxygenase [Celerinatantimonas yamalensis]|uniref:FAD-dependent monooxygenase n=1 Tax=Celerinatantimonas yamalensis TaxID=559956 RepID=A0ABW9G9F5_9GAMM
MKKFDAIVIGGGMVGAATACGLAMQQQRVAMIDPVSPAPFDPSLDPDLRLSAFSLASGKLLQQLGAWPLIEQMRLTPYTELQTWESGMTQRLTFDCEQINQPQLGWMIENRLVQLALWQRCEQLGVAIFPWQDWQLDQSHSEFVSVQSGGEQLMGKLVVGADGANSRVRQQAGIGVSGWDYRQRCLSMNVKFTTPISSVTWQEFHPSGPRALLPLYDNYGALIWYDKSATIKQLQKLSAANLKAQIEKAFPKLESDFELLDWASFPLVRRHAQRYIQGRIILAGDSAHTIHPLAGQGVNIGFKDVAQLLKLAHEYEGQNVSVWGGQYQRCRKADNLMMQSTMDLLYKSFSHPHPAVAAVRKLGLQLAQNSGALKKQALRYAVGV